MFSDNCSGDCANCNNHEKFYRGMDNVLSFLAHLLEEEPNAEPETGDDSNTTQSLDDVIDVGVLNIALDEIQRHIGRIKANTPDRVVAALNAVGSYMSTVTKDDLLNIKIVRLQLEELLNTASTPVVVRNLREALNNISRDLLMVEKTPEFFYELRDRAVMLKDMPCPKKHRDTVLFVVDKMKSLIDENEINAFNSMASIIATIQNIRW